MTSIRIRLFLHLIFSTLLAATLIAPSVARAELISINVAGTDTGNGDAFGAGFPPDLSADGRFVVFATEASDLVATLDTNGAFDVFVRDRLLGTTELISTNLSGTDSGDGLSVNPTISDDGRFVAFRSAASDLVAVDTNGQDDVFVHDRMTSTTVAMSLNDAGTDTGSLGSRLPIISPDGSSAVFLSLADDLVATDTNGAEDVYVRDFTNDTTLLVTINVGGTDSGAGGGVVVNQVPVPSANGRLIAHSSTANDLVAGDVNGVADVFVFDLDTGTNTLASPSLAGTTTANGASTVPSISDDGTAVVFASTADNLVATDTNGATDFFVRDLAMGVTDLVSRPTGSSDSITGGAFAVGPSAISADGNLIAFNSFADGFVADDDNGTADVFLRDRAAGTTSLVSATPTGTVGDGESFVLAAFSTPFSADGLGMVFISSASDLTNRVDANNTSDIFLRDLQTGTTTLLSASLVGSAGAGASFNPTISADGTSAAFLSNATNLTLVDTNGLTDIFAATPALLFEDGFESGDTAAWSTTVP